MADPAIVFASNFDASFRSLTREFTHNEIPLFQAMHSALVGLSGKFQIEEYHGTSHQVIFTGNGSYARTHARCELSDLLIVTYSSSSHNARLTYLQAKSERATLHSVCGRAFSANLEQWFLLSTRPHIVYKLSYLNRSRGLHINASLLTALLAIFWNFLMIVIVVPPLQTINVATMAIHMSSYTMTFSNSWLLRNQFPAKKAGQAGGGSDTKHA